MINLKSENEMFERNITEKINIFIKLLDQKTNGEQFDHLK